MRRVLLLAALLAITIRADAQPPPNYVEAMRLDTNQSVLLDNGCVYRLLIGGTLTPVAQANSTEPAVRPVLSVNAQLECQSQATVVIDESSLGVAPMTRAALRQILEERSTVITDISGVRCVYRPRLVLEQANVRLRRVETRCPAP